MPVPNPLEVRQLADEMLALEAKLNALKVRWESMFQGNYQRNLPTEPQKSLELVSEEPKNLGGRPPRDNSVSSRVLELINEDPNLHWDSGMLARKLGVERKPVESALNNLFVAKKIARHSRGNYEAIPQYADAVEKTAEEKPY